MCLIFIYHFYIPKNGNMSRKICFMHTAILFLCMSTYLNVSVKEMTTANTYYSCVFIVFFCLKMGKSERCIVIYTHHWTIIIIILHTTRIFKGKKRKGRDKHVCSAFAWKILLMFRLGQFSCSVMMGATSTTICTKLFMFDDLLEIRWA